MKKHFNFCLAIIFIALLTSGAIVRAQSSGGGYQITQSVIAGGGGTSIANPNLQLDGTVGQPIQDTSSGGSFTLNGGFWPSGATQTPLPNLSINNVSLAEGNNGLKDFVFTVTLNAPNASPVTVQYATADGTASSPSDYAAVNAGTLTIPANQPSGTITIQINGDALFENNESFTLNLSKAANATITGAQATATIINDDAAPQPAPNVGAVIISEFRLRGPLPAADTINGSALDEFIELYNNTDAPITVGDGGSFGWALVASDGIVRFIVPNGTVIPARGHYLAANNTNPGGYSLGAYAAPDITYTTDIPDDTGITLFKTADVSGFTSLNALDAVGFNILPNTLFKEGAGLAPIGANDGEYSWVRRSAPDSSNFDGLNGRPQDTNDNAADFFFVSTTAAMFGATQSKLGAPGSENLSSPLLKNSGQVTGQYLDPLVAGTLPPNRARFLCSDAQRPENCDPAKSNNGFISIRRTYVNNTSANIASLRFRVIDLTTLNNDDGLPAPVADLRVLSSMDMFIPTFINPAGVLVRGTTLEHPPDQTIKGGGLNSSLAVTFATPLMPGQSANIQYLLGVQATGRFRFIVNIEALP
jgi:hypothetical protein